MTDEQVIIKTGLKTGAGSSHGKSVQFGSSFFTPFMTLYVDSRPRVNEVTVQRTASMF